MESKTKSQRKCFTFIWTLENARYCWQKKYQYVQSPVFLVDQIKETKWALQLYPRHGDYHVGIYLRTLPESEEANLEINYEIAFIAFNGTVLGSVRCEKRTFDTVNRFGSFFCVKRDEVLPTSRSAFQQQDALTIRCRIWKTVGEISENVQCVSRTRIKVVKRMFMWNIGNFSAFESGRYYVIKSLNSNKKLMSLRLSLNPDETLLFLITLCDQRMKYCTLHFSAVDTSKNTIASLRDDIWSDVLNQKKSFEVKMLLTKKQLMEKKDIYLPNDVLSLKCKCVMSFGSPMEEIEGIYCDNTASENNELLNNSCPEPGNTLSVSKSVLNESFKSLLNQEKELPPYKSVMINNLQSIINDGTLSDVKLRTKNQTYPAHMFILSARSPVFKAMFSCETKQQINGCVNIEDLDDDTVFRILQYIYSCKVGVLDWKSACKLYVGAKKYQIQALKDICSSYLKSNLSLTNACGTLLIADLSQDEDLKAFVQCFVVKYSKIIMNSEHWDKLMKTNLKLAAETMHINFKK